MRKVFTSLLFLLLLPSSAAAAFDSDLAIPPENVRFSTETLLEGNTVRIYASVVNPGSNDLRGVVRFFASDKQIMGDQPVSVIAGKEDSVFVDWKTFPGNFSVRVLMVPFEPEGDDPANNTVEKHVTVLADTDRDGRANRDDPDDDNDGVPDAQDAFPLNKNESADSDGDTIGNNADPDDDNDGTLDTQDEMPLNAAETKDTDKDGIGNNEDTDDDGDGIPDAQESAQGTDPAKADTDGDGVNDKVDVFPTAATESHDFDGDGVGNNADRDADGDGIAKPQDTNDTNLGPVIKITANGGTPPKILKPRETKSFEATDSKDPDGGQIGDVNWTVDGKTFQGAVFQTSFNKPGRHIIRVAVRDDEGETREKTFSVFVAPPWGIRLISAGIFLVLILAIFAAFSYSKRR